MEVAGAAVRSRDGEIGASLEEAAGCDLARKWAGESPGLLPVL